MAPLLRLASSERDAPSGLTGKLEADAARHTESGQLDRSRAYVEEAVLSAHARRARNPKSADWLINFGRYVIAYDHPDEDDVAAARIVTVWRT